MTDPTLQAYYDAHDRMMDEERAKAWSDCWAEDYGLYKVARYNAVKAGLIPEQPQFDVEDARARRREALRELTRLTEEYGGYEELKNNVEDAR